MAHEIPDNPLHGGNLDDAARAFGRPAAGWLDLSTGINPVPYGNMSVARDSFTRLPQPGQMAALLAAARSVYGVADSAGLVAAPGSQAVFQALPGLRPPCRVAVLGPTYEEHVVTWRGYGHDVAEVETLAAAADADVVVLVNPNNPDGRVVPPGELADCAAALAARGGWLVVDEAFADVAPAVSVIGRADIQNLVVVRSFGKFFGLPGLRLGFAAGDPPLIEELAARLGPWAVAGPALEIATRALADAAWIAATRDALAAKRERMDAVLAAAGLSVIGGTDLYRLVDTSDALAIYRRLGAAGILVRRFDRHPAWLRFGLPEDEDGLTRLATALAAAPVQA